ncbi:hypothetical protein HZC09_00450 [Candidatus Micrarchaeota archaeon]|nr:hypothetical protein [Candidatus Micrarchaeota archaeon]
MDFTFLFIIIIMMLAVKSELWFIALGLFVILLVTSKNKYLLIASFLGLALILIVNYAGMSSYLGDLSTWVVLGILFLILLLLARNDSEQPSPAGYYPGMG